MAGLSNAQVNILINARSTAQAAFQETATGIKGVTAATDQSTTANTKLKTSEELAAEGARKQQVAYQQLAAQLIQAQVQSESLSRTQQDSIRTGSQLGLTLQQISDKTGISIDALKQYQAGLRATQQAEGEAEAGNNKLVSAVGRLVGSNLGGTFGQWTSQLGPLTGGFTALSGTILAIGGGIIALGLAAKTIEDVGSILKISVNAATEYETSLTKIVNLAGETKASIRGLSDEVMAMAGQVGKGPQELSEGLYFIASNGIHGAQALDLLKNSAEASAIGLGKTEDVAHALVGVMKAYEGQGLSSAQATRVLIATVQEGNVEANQLAGTLGRVVGNAAALGISFDQVGAFIATFTRVGVDASEAVTALRGMLGILEGQGRKSRDALAGVGLTLEQLREEVREKGLTAALLDLNERFDGNIEKLREFIPNVRTLAGVLSTAQAQGKDFSQVQKNIAEAMGDASFVSERMANVQETLAFQTNALRAVSQAMAIQIGQQVTPALTELAKEARPVAEGLSAIAVWMTKLAAAEVTGHVKFVIDFVNSAGQHFLGATPKDIIDTIQGAFTDVGEGPAVKRKTDISLPNELGDAMKIVQQSLQPIKDYTKVLAEARAEVDRLSASEKAQIAAAEKVHASEKDIVEALNNQNPALRLTVEGLKLYEDQMKASAKATKEDGSQALDQFLKGLYKLDFQVQAALDSGTSWDAVIAKWGPQLSKAKQEATDLGVTIGDLGDDFITATEKAEQAHWADIVAKQYAGIHTEAEKFYANQAKLLKQSVDERNTGLSEGYKTSRDLEQKYEDERAKLTLTGVDYQIYQANRWMEIEKGKLNTRSSTYQENANKIEAIHGLMVQEIIRASDPMFQLWVKLKEQAVSLVGDINNDFAAMLTGVQSFGEGFNSIWDSIKKTAQNVLADILQYFEKVWIAKMTASLLGGGSIWATVLSQVFHTGVQSGVNAGINAGINIGTNIASADATAAASGIGAQVGSAGASGAGLAAGHTGLITSSGIGSVGWGTVAGVAGGALAGGIVGWKVGRATGNWQAGVAAGAGTGAAVGSVAGPWGTAIGAGVGAVAGAWGAHKANEDARDQMVAIRAELEKTFGSLDAVRQQASLVGVNIDDAFANIGRGVKGTKEFNAVVEEFQSKWNNLDAAMKRYGITLDDLTKSPQQKFSDQVKQIQTDFDALAGTGSKLGTDTILSKMAGSFNDLLVQAQATGNKLPASLEPLLQRMNQLGLITDDTRAKLLGLTSASDADLQKASEIAQKYGISLAQLGPKFEQAQISARAKDILTDFGALKDLNVDIGGSLAGMSDEISQFVQDAIKAGAEVPDNMRPILQELVDNRQLIGENGQALTDLTQIKFGAPIADQFQPVTDAIHELIDVLSGKGPVSLPSALEDGIQQMQGIARNSKIQIPVGFSYETLDVPNLPQAAGGVMANRPGLVVFGEGGESELGGPRSFFQDVFESLGIGTNMAPGGQAAAGSGDTHVTINMPISPGVPQQQQERWLQEHALPALLSVLDRNPDGVRVKMQRVLGVGG